MQNDAAIFAAVRTILQNRHNTGFSIPGFTQAEVDLLNQALHPTDGITLNMALELLHHEALVREAYKDSRGIWTWSVGVTNASGHPVTQYIDKPQSIAVCLAAYVALLRTKYGPNVERAFGRRLTEAQFTAALSFEYNTGAINRADWVQSFKAGNIAQAKKEIMNWKSPPEIIGRRTAERDLFFDGVWSNDGKTTILGVRKPSYQPDWKSAKRVDIRADLQTALGM